MNSPVHIVQAGPVSLPPVRAKGGHPAGLSTEQPSARSPAAAPAPDLSVVGAGISAGHSLVSLMLWPIQPLAWQEKTSLLRVYGGVPLQLANADA